jgi:hypothetical protein
MGVKVKRIKEYECDGCGTRQQGEFGDGVPGITGRVTETTDSETFEAEFFACCHGCVAGAIANALDKALDAQADRIADRINGRGVDKNTGVRRVVASPAWSTRR